MISLLNTQIFLIEMYDFMFYNTNRTTPPFHTVIFEFFFTDFGMKHSIFNW